MRSVVLCLLAGLFFALSSTSAWGRRGRTLRLTSYNIQHGAGLDGKIDHERQALVLRRAHADVAAIQEVDSVTKRNGGVFSLEEIGRKARMFSTFAPAINFQGGKYGIGILSRKRPISVRRIPLPGREEPRMLLVAEFKHYVVACTHLSLTDADRMASIPILLAEAQRWQKPFILTGDLNDEPGMPFYEEMQKHFVFLNAPSDNTFPADVPNICIDHVAIYRPTGEAALSSFSTRVGEEQFSDHRPLHARIGLFR